MRRTLLFLVFIVVSMIAKAQFTVYQPVYPDNSRSVPIVPRTNSRYPEYVPTPTVVSGKTYNAIVLYESSTGHENTYKLPVVVKNGSVDKICFSDGGSVHTGINNSGYKYYGGKLEYVKDLDAYVTEVTIVYSSTSWHKYTVVIQ